MKIVVAYESMFGNTRTVGEAIAEGLRPRELRPVRGDRGLQIDQPSIDQAVRTDRRQTLVDDAMLTMVSRVQGRVRAASAHPPPQDQPLPETLVRKLLAVRMVEAFGGR